MPDPLASPLAKGDALPYRGSQGTGEFAGRRRARDHAPWPYDAGATRLQVSQPTQHADDQPADLLDHGGSVSIAGRLGFDKPGLEAQVGAIEIEGTAKTLDKRHRPRLNLGPGLLREARGSLGEHQDRGPTVSGVSRMHITYAYMDIYGRATQTAKVCQNGISLKTALNLVLTRYCQYNGSPCSRSRACVLERVGMSGPIVDGLVYCLPLGAPSWPWHKVLPIKSC